MLLRLNFRRVLMLVISAALVFLGSTSTAGQLLAAPTILTLTVDRMDDTNATATQSCQDSTPNDCSLRGAISKANANNSKCKMP